MADWCHTMGWQQAWDFIVDKTLQHWDSGRLRKWSFWNEYERIQTDGLQQWLSSTSPAYYLEDSLVPRHFTDQVEWSASCVHFVWLVIQDVHETCFALTIQEKMQPRIRNWAASTPFCFISWRFGCKWSHQSLHIAVVLNHKDFFAWHSLLVPSIAQIGKSSKEYNRFATFTGWHSCDQQGTIGNVVQWATLQMTNLSFSVVLGSQRAL